MTINNETSTRSEKRSEVEHIKERSAYLAGTLLESLEDGSTGSLLAQDQHLIKFHGSYVQNDRELDKERKEQKLEPLYSFMIRVRVPGGIATPAQWLALDTLADMHGNPTLKLTTRQAFELHGVLKHNLKATIRGINDTLLDTIAACGDVNRNVMSTVNPHTSTIHDDVQASAKAISDHLTPRTASYFQIWLNDGTSNELVAGAGNADEHTTNAETEGVEPIYGKTYLPRKFKIALAIPPYNDTDVFANDIGLIAIEEQGALAGFNITAGGGMGMTFGESGTYPRVGDVLGFVAAGKAVDVCEKIVTIQRDYGNRENRRNARLKYTIDRVGLDFFREELHKRLGYELQPAKPFTFTTNGDSYGWVRGANGRWFTTLFIEGGRVGDTAEYRLKTALREVASIHDGDFRLTGNQNLVIANASEAAKAKIDAVLEQYGVAAQQTQSALRLHSLACVALNLCPLANAEAERYLPSLVGKIESALAANNLTNDAITIRMTGCPNGCARPYIAEIGLVGRAPGKYNLYLGAAHDGSRLNKLYKETLNEAEILAELTPLFAAYASERTDGERFGDFVVRKSVVAATTHGTNFHE